MPSSHEQIRLIAPLRKVFSSRLSFITNIKTLNKHILYKKIQNVTKTANIEHYTKNNINSVPQHKIIAIKADY